VADYIKSTNFAVKDTLTTGNPAKIVKGTEIDTEFNAIASAIASKLDANSPTLTGTPLAPTASTATNNTQIATTAYVVNRITQDIAGKANIASPTFTGTPAAPTAASGTNTTQLATTAFVIQERTAAATLTGKTISGVDNTLTVRLNEADVTGTLPLAKGGTAATTAADARTNLSVPSTTGSDASGTWGISITGNAATATSATTATNVTNAVGSGQSWQSVTRSGSTNYQNTTDKPIMVAITFVGRGGQGFVGVNTSSYIHVTGATTGVAQDTNSRPVHSFIVPPNHYYKSEGGSLDNWKELR
jgi:hypothetical protein